MKHTNKNTQGFTLLEVLLVVAIIAILAGIVILAINPNKQLAESRNAERRSDVRTIIDAIYQFLIDNNGTLPSGITTSASQICATGGDCTGLIDLNTELDADYLISLPKDPQGGTDDTTGYTVLRSGSGASARLTVCAPSAEQSETICVTR